MNTYQEHLDHIQNTMLPLMAKLTTCTPTIRGSFKPSHFYFVGFYGGKSEEEYEEEKDVCRFAVVMKTFFDHRDGTWEDGEHESTLMQALNIPLFYESACVYSFRNLMDTVSRLLGGEPPNTKKPALTPQEVRKLFLAAGFEEKPAIIHRWNPRADILVESGRELGAISG